MLDPRHLAIGNEKQKLSSQNGFYEKKNFKKFILKINLKRQCNKEEDFF